MILFVQEKCSNVSMSTGLMTIVQLGVQPNSLPSTCKRGLIKVGIVLTVNVTFSFKSIPSPEKSSNDL